MELYKSTRRKKVHRDIILKIPVYLTMYLHLLLNLVIVGFFCNIMFKFSRMVEKDIEKFVSQKTNLVYADIFRCEGEYLRNGCDSNQLVPALESVCFELAKCKMQDPTLLKMRASVEIFADILNDFCNKLSDRTIYCLLVCIVGVFVVTRTLLRT